MSCFIRKKKKEKRNIEIGDKFRNVSDKEEKENNK